MLVPTELLEHLRCSLCKKVLSRFPIYVKKDLENQLLSVCGRCQLPDDKSYFRNTIYESVIKHLQFPCINRQNGCMEYLIPENIEQHELLCQYQVKQCKFCEWSGQSFTVLDHYQSAHADLILKNNTFKLNAETPHTTNILIHKEAVFSYECDFDQDLERIQCTLGLIFSTRNVKKYYAQFNVIADDATVSKRFPGIDIDDIEPKSIDISIENMLDDCNIEAMAVIIITTDIRDLSFKYVRKQIEENLSKSKANPYALCTNMANFDNNLQTSSQLSKLSCELCRYGCGYTSFNASDLNQHYSRCLNKTYTCMFTYKENNQLKKCDEVIARKALVAHIRNKHESEIKTVIHELPFALNILGIARKRCCKYLVYPANSYLLIIEYVEPCLLLLRVELVHSSADEEANTCTFEINMFNKKNGTRLSLRQSCAELACNKEYNVNDNPCIWLHLDQIKNFIHNNVLRFGIIILP